MSCPEGTHVIGFSADGNCMCPDGVPCAVRCGDGLQGPGEGCDDGNTVSDDGCSATCTVESGGQCVSAAECQNPPLPAVCFAPACTGGECAYVPQPAVVCGPATCADGIVTNARVCGADGSCPSAGQTSCLGYACDPAGTACLTSCAGAADCRPGYHCADTACVPDVADTVPPALTVPADITREATGPYTTVNWAAGLSATDLVDGDCVSTPGGAPYTGYCLGSDAVTGSCIVACSNTSGALYTVGTNPVQCCAKDTDQNMSSGSFNVTVRDTTGPVVTPPPAPPPTPSTDGDCTMVIFNDQAAADDLVDGTWTFTCTPASGSCFAVGTHYIDCRTSDSRGNLSAPAGFNLVVTSAPY